MGSTVTYCGCDKSHEKEPEVKEAPMKFVSVDNFIKASYPSTNPAPKAKVFYTIQLDRSQGGKLGIDCDQQEDTLLITHIHPEGLVTDWNSVNTMQVAAGDCILEVNGVRDDVAKLVTECKREALLEMGLSRQV
mmetsp:Transcript_66188/g.158311  ORF Transcript_66188/g.158311 Transcript_66188/m.158311 type:complete len:134 (+) Transcript_66188:63-464(+)|eukprot:CAMPEP_0178431752 /NCGR_PEP_ID=MMETSP0689_2-20121128/32023_1 /TAXON_ID=160604 /ORGANISM="Amphidinium massartii, Strain CS-259" /LENGTH=133 /DNA_ID=CAMNT_0020053701 /DNA_START=61 /DNA_END=462 /DNA_ORIENTATION=+